MKMNGTILRRIVAPLCLVGCMGFSSLALAQFDDFIEAGRDPVRLHVPAAYQEGTPIPLVVSLHGYTSNGSWHEDYTQLVPLSDSRGFLLALPDGLPDLFGFPYWNATDACCDFFGNTDDSGYLIGLVDLIAEEYSVDPSRVYFFGHSNGGFMSYRMACDHSTRIAAIVSLAGATWSDPVDCSPSAPVHILQVHGLLDNVIFFNGGNIFGADYPGAIGSAVQWLVQNGCDSVLELVPPALDLDAAVPGNDTLPRRFAQGCLPGGSAELWPILGGGHSPDLTTQFREGIVDFMLSRSKP
jgi:polyhydroxybutyrate depolymerase